MRSKIDPLMLRKVLMAAMLAGGLFIIREPIRDAFRPPTAEEQRTSKLEAKRDRLKDQIEDCARSIAYDKQAVQAAWEAEIKARKRGEAPEKMARFHRARAEQLQAENLDRLNRKLAELHQAEAELRAGKYGDEEEGLQ